MREKKSPQIKDSYKSISQKPLPEETAKQSFSSKISLDRAAWGPPELPTLPNTPTLRRQLFQVLQRQLGNAAVVRRFVAKGKHSERVSQMAPPRFLQRDGEGEQESETDSGTPGAAPGAAIGRTTGGDAAAATSIQNGTEEFYDVSGDTLNDITGQLAHFDGQYGAQTETHLGISTEEMPIQRRPNGTLRVAVPWSINSAVVGLPRWTTRAGACAVAQQEWDRFLRRARQHEQEAHVDMAYQFVTDLGPGDRIVTGRDADALRRNLAAKQRVLRGRLQSLHNGCDHGASIDAILHPDNGRCT